MFLFCSPEVKSLDGWRDRSSHLPCREAQGDARASAARQAMVLARSATTARKRARREGIGCRQRFDITCISR
jgi:hypothetical protein